MLHLPTVSELHRIPCLLQATVQAALAQLPADAVARAYPVGSPDYTEYTQFGMDALTTAVFEIINSGTLGCLLVRWLSPFLLKRVRHLCICVLSTAPFDPGF